MGEKKTKRKKIVSDVTVLRPTDCSTTQSWHNLLNKLLLVHGASQNCAVGWLVGILSQVNHKGLHHG